MAGGLLTDAELRARGVTLLLDEARATLDALTPEDIRIEWKSRNFQTPEMTEPEVLKTLHVMIRHDGRWLTLARADLCGEVESTLTPILPRADVLHPVRMYRNRIQFGARVTDDAFVVIDSWSDG